MCQIHLVALESSREIICSVVDESPTNCASNSSRSRPPTHSLSLVYFLFFPASLVIMNSGTSLVNKAEKERTKLIQERCQHYLTELLKDDDNKYCVDCDAKGTSDAGLLCSQFFCLFNLIIYSCNFYVFSSSTFRSTMGLMELGYISLHKMRRHPS